MAKKQRNRRSARQARSQERAEQVAKATGVTVEEAKQAQVEEAAKPKAEEAKRGSRMPAFMQRIAGYFSDVRTELRRVTWPTSREVRSYSVCVIAMLVVVGVAIWLVDTGIVGLLITFSGLRG